MKRDNSRRLFKEAKKYIPGGVNSPVRAFNAVGGDPVFMEKAAGAYLYDVDGNKYIDFIGTWGPAILGHANPNVIEALKRKIENGTSFGTPTEPEVELAKLVTANVPGADMVRFVNSGTEATMTAIRLARGYTGRDKIVKFEGCYHGHSDGLLVKAGSGGATLNIPTSPGVPRDYIKNTIVLPFNDADALKKTLHDEEIAGVIMEPVAGNMGVVVGSQEFLEAVRVGCTETGAVLIFDEVMSGFRVHEKGAQGLLGVIADLVCLGKVIGGGMPVGAIAGGREIMSYLAPEGNVYQAGTLSGNPIAMTAGIKTLEVFYNENVMKYLRETGEILEAGLEKLSEKYKGISYNVVGGMFTLFFCDEEPANFEEVSKCDFERFSKFFTFMLDNGILIPPSQYEANFLSFAHAKKEIVRYLELTEKFLKI